MATCVSLSLSSPYNFIIFNERRGEMFARWFDRIYKNNFYEFYFHYVLYVLCVTMYKYYVYPYM